VIDSVPGLSDHFMLSDYRPFVFCRRWSACSLVFGTVQSLFRVVGGHRRGRWLRRDPASYGYVRPRLRRSIWLREGRRSCAPIYVIAVALCGSRAPLLGRFRTAELSISRSGWSPLPPPPPRHFPVSVQPAMTGDQTQPGEPRAPIWTLVGGVRDPGDTGVRVQYQSTERVEIKLVQPFIGAGRR
jgi:hypothetical protein